MFTRKKPVGGSVINCYGVRHIFDALHQQLLASISRSQLERKTVRLSVANEFRQYWPQIDEKPIFQKGSPLRRGLSVLLFLVAVGALSAMVAYPAWILGLGWFRT